MPGATVGPRRSGTVQRRWYVPTELGHLSHGSAFTTAYLPPTTRQDATPERRGRASTLLVRVLDDRHVNSPGGCWLLAIGLLETSRRIRVPQANGPWLLVSMSTRRGNDGTIFGIEICLARRCGAVLWGSTLDHPSSNPPSLRLTSRCSLRRARRRTEA